MINVLKPNFIKDLLKHAQEIRDQKLDQSNMIMMTERNASIIENSQLSLNYKDDKIGKFVKNTRKWTPRKKTEYTKVDISFSNMPTNRQYREF